MIAVITSTIKPEQSADDGGKKSYLGVEKRLQQTSRTIDRLLAHPFNKIYLIDNSEDFDYRNLRETYKNKLEILSFRQYQFKNKGINELLMLLAFIEHAPSNEAIFKISGRYFPNENFLCNIGEHTYFKVKAYNFYEKRGTISTRAYFVVNKEVYKDFLLKTLNEVFAYPKRIVGLRSAIESAKQLFKPSLTVEPTTSIEFAAARVLKYMGYKLEIVDTIGVEGRIAGFADLPSIIE